MPPLSLLSHCPYPLSLPSSSCKPHAWTAGKLLGLHSGDGRVLWGLALDPSCPPTHLKLWRTSHDAVHAPQVRAPPPPPSLVPLDPVRARACRTPELLQRFALDTQLLLSIMVPYATVCCLGRMQL